MIIKTITLLDGWFLYFGDISVAANLTQTNQTVVMDVDCASIKIQVSNK